jgi:hypothetical protein
MVATAGPQGPRRLSIWLERTDAHVGVRRDRKLPTLLALRTWVYRTNRMRIVGETKWCRLDSEAWWRMLKEQTEIHLDEEGFAWALLVESTSGPAFYGILLEGAKTPNKSLTRKGKRTPGANVRKPGWWSKIARLDTSHTNIWIFANDSDILILQVSGPEISPFQLINIYNKKGLEENQEWTIKRSLESIKPERRSIIYGDFNAHHSWWNSRISNPIRCSELIP